MNRTAYVFMLVIIGLALLLHALDERSDRIVIHESAAIALHDGVTEACDARNGLRDAIWEAAASFHEDARRDQVRKTLHYENCDKLGDEAVMNFRRAIEDKARTESILNKLLQSTD